MKAVRIHGYGAAPVMEDVALPAPGPGQVLVRVKAASLNPLDVKLHSGAMHGYFRLAFPYTMATDLSGTVEQTGPDAGSWARGDAVVARLGSTSGGALAEFALLPAGHLTAAPTTTSLDDEAGLPTAAGTAWQALFEVAGLEGGQTVLVHAGAGGVGSCAIQLARNAGARVIATASGSGLDIARRLGADRVTDYRSEPFDTLSDIDIVLDTVGGETQQQSFEVLRTGGVLVSAVSPPDEALAKSHGIRASMVYHQSDAARLRTLVELVDAGALRVLVDRTVPLTSFADALRHQASGRARGKFILSLEGLAP